MTWLCLGRIPGVPLLLFSHGKESVTSPIYQPILLPPLSLPLSRNAWVDSCSVDIC